MHVAFSVLTLVPGQIGGTETYVRGLVRAYGELAAPRVTVLAPEAAAASLEGAGPVEIVPVGLRIGASPPARLAGLAHGLLAPPRSAVRAAATADVLHLPLTVPIPRAPVPTVVTLHDVLHLDVPGAVGRAERAYRRVAYDRAARRADLVVTVSEHARERIVARLGIAPERVVAIPHGIDHERFRPDGDDSPLAGLALPDGPFVLYPANLWPHKNHARLLDALARVPGVSLVLTGAAYGRLGPLQDRARALGVADRVRHLGYVPAAALAPLYRRATAVVFPSLYEGFGSPVVEAMACGCPVAASDRGAVAEAAGGAALGFAPEDAAAIAAAMTRVCGDDAERARLREAGLRRASGLTWRASAERHVAAYAAASSSSASTASRP